MTHPELQSEGRPRPLRWFHVLLLLMPFVALLWPPFYARWQPEIFGLPFFYAYQFGWIFGSAAITGFVYRSTRSRR